MESIIKKNNQIILLCLLSSYVSYLILFSYCITIHILINVRLIYPFQCIIITNLNYHRIIDKIKITNNNNSVISQLKNLKH